MTGRRSAPPRIAIRVVAAPAPAAIALVTIALIPFAGGPAAHAKPKAVVPRTIAAQGPMVPIPNVALPPLERDQPLTDPYQEMVRRLTQRGPADTLGDGLFALAERAFYGGAPDEAMRLYQEFAQRHTRNLRLNAVLERILLIRESRDFEDQPLKAYARAELLRRSGAMDSAAAAIQEALQRFPGARLRWHFHYALAEIAREKGNHAAAVRHALVVADTSAHTRLAPYALKLAGDETLASGGDLEQAAGYYQSLLERYPESPLAPSVRVQLLAMRKRMQL